MTFSAKFFSYKDAPYVTKLIQQGPAVISLYLSIGHADGASALCLSNGFDAGKLRKTNASLVDQAKGKDLESLKSWLSSHSLKDGSHYSRLMAVGLMSLIKAASKDSNESETDAIIKLSGELSESLGLPTDRVEKDLTLFGSNSERMDQAVELVEETIAAEKRKKERRLAEQAQRTSN